MSDPRSWPSTPTERSLHGEPHGGLKRLRRTADVLLKGMGTAVVASALLGWGLQGMWATQNGLQGQATPGLHDVPSGLLPLLLIGFYRVTAVLGSTLAVHLNQKQDTQNTKHPAGKWALTAGGMLVLMLLLGQALDLYSSTAPETLLWGLSYLLFGGVIAAAAFLLTLTRHAPLARHARILLGVLALVVLGGGTLWMTQHSNVNDYYSRLPKQFGGAQPTRAVLILKAAPATLYPAGLAPQDGSGRSRELDLVYLGQDHLVVKIPGEPHLYQLSKTQVRTLISKP